MTDPRRVTAAEMKALDRAAIDDYGIPALVLMENAGRSAAEIIARDHKPGAGRVTMVCGRGNNGGDGFVIARHLHHRGYAVEIVYNGDPEQTDGLTDETRTNLAIVKKLRLPLLSPDHPDRPDRLDALANRLAGAGLIVDALLGIGLTGPVRERAGAIIDAINGAATPTVAIDIPSGLDADSGEPLGRAVRAATTVTFGLPKIGLFAGHGPEYVGRLDVVDMGLPAELIMIPQILEPPRRQGRQEKKTNSQED